MHSKWLGIWHTNTVEGVDYRSCRNQCSQLAAPQGLTFMYQTVGSEMFSLTDEAAILTKRGLR